MVLQVSWSPLGNRIIGKLNSLFITGATGYLGRELCRVLDPRQRKIFCLVRPGRGEKLASGLTAVEGDLLDPATYSRELAQCDTVLHLAALTGKAKAAEYFRVNADGTRALVEACLHAGKPNLLLVSTIAAAFSDVYKYHYARSKQAAEQIVRTSGLRHTIVRPAMIFGPGAPVLESLRKLAAGPFVVVPGSGRVLAQPVFVGDVVRGLIEILETGNFHNQTLEFGGPGVVSMRELLLAVRDAAGAPPAKVVHLPLELLRRPLGILDFLAPQLPVTAGQFASFANPGICKEDGLSSYYRTGRRGLTEMLQSSGK